MKTDFDVQLKALKDMTDSVENWSLSFADQITAYEQGVELVKACQEILTQAGHKVTQVNSSVKLKKTFWLPTFKARDRY